MQLCRACDAEPLLRAFNKRTPQDAADEVEYFNGSEDSHWGGYRTKNGHREPYKIRYWQIGNEVTGEAYETNFRAFAEAMKKIDPSIKILSSFPTAKLLDNAADVIDYVAPHHYSGDLASMEQNFRDIDKMIREHGKGRNIKVAVTEWNTTAGDAGPSGAMLWSLANALAWCRDIRISCTGTAILSRSPIDRTSRTAFVPASSRPTARDCTRRRRTTHSRCTRRSRARCH